MDRAEANIFKKRLIDARAVGGWEIEAYLGHGKSAVVMLAQKAGTAAAIKIFHPGLVEQYGLETQRIRILREKSLVGRSHPNLVEILDAGECHVTGYLYVAMRYIPGKSLSSEIKNIPRKNIAMLVEQLARAVKQLEDWEIIHRDIKPDNIQISEDYGNLKLLDFGVIKPIGDNSATEQQPSKGFLGTHQYCPPEMIHGKEEDSVDGWRAITFYQIGAVLHDLINQRKLFAEAAARTPAELISAIDGVEVIFELKDVDPALCNLATRCLLKNPGDRIRLVAWPDFFMSEQQGIPVGRKERKDALARYLSVGKLHASDPLDRYENSRLEVVFLEQTSKSIRTQFDRALASLSALLPSRTVTVEPQAHPFPSLTAVFRADPARGFNLPFHIQLAFEVIGGSRIVKVYARAGFGADAAEIGWSLIIELLDDFSGLSDSIEDWLLGLLEELIKR